MTPSLWCFAAGHSCVTPSLCCSPIGFRNSREFRAELDDRMSSQKSINSIASYNSGIPGNSYRLLLIIQFRNSREFLPIPSFYPIPEFRVELDDRMGSQTSINSITFYNSGIG